MRGAGSPKTELTPRPGAFPRPPPFAQTLGIGGAGYLNPLRLQKVLVGTGGGSGYGGEEAPHAKYSNKSRRFLCYAELCTDAQELKVPGHPKTPRFPETPSQLPLKSVSFVLKAGSTYARNQVGKTGC